MRTILPSSVAGSLRAGVVEDPVAHLVGEVQPLGDRAQRLLVVAEAPAEALLQRLVERLLAGVAERRMAEVVAEPDRLGQVLVQPQRPGDDAGDRRSSRACASSACGSGRRAGSMKTCVLPFSRRNGFEWTIRSRSRWNGVRTRHSSSARAAGRASRTSARRAATATAPSAARDCEPRTASGHCSGDLEASTSSG